MDQIIYFISDFHLGVDAKTTSKEREKLICKCLELISQDADIVFLVGDVFDFWFDYKLVIPRGYVRLLGQLATMRDKGIEIHFFTGNHDLWMFDYFTKELGIPIHTSPREYEFSNKKFLIGHGDGLGPGDHGYKLIKKVFSASILQWAFRWIHPDIGIRIANFFSSKSRNAQVKIQEYLGKDNEWLAIYSESILDSKYYDYLIFGHRHLPIDLILKNGKSRYINLGEWLNFQSYARFDGQNLELKFFENEDGKIFP